MSPLPNPFGAVSPPFLCLAPLHGITDCYFRSAYATHFPGFDELMAPFIPAASCTRPKSKHFRDLSGQRNANLKVIPQLLSNDAQGMVATAAILADMGYDEFNWNLGCPFPRVVSKRRGSGLLPHPDLIEEILDQVCSRIGIAMSIKLRLGWDDPQEILRLLPRLDRYPLKKIIIHPRTGIQMYSGDVDLDGFSRAMECTRHEVMYNGDIFSPDRFESLRKRFPQIREWMIGRWAICWPFLAGEIKGELPSVDPLQRIRDFHDELYYLYQKHLFGPVHVLNKLKEIWQYLGDSFQGQSADLKKINRCRDAESYEELVHGIFAKAQGTGLMRMVSRS